MIRMPLIWAVDADLIITIAIVLFGIIIPLILNVVNKLKEVQQKMAGGGPPQQQRPRPRPADPNVEDEIGEFLRRAAARRQGAPPQQQPQAVRRPLQEQPVEAVLLEPSSASHRPDVAEHVAHDIDTRKFSEREKQARRRAAEAERKAKQRSRKFEHEVSHLPGGSGAARSEHGKKEPPKLSQADAGAGLAAGLPALLRNTHSLRQAIVINEILQRPEDRWI